MSQLQQQKQNSMKGNVLNQTPPVSSVQPFSVDVMTWNKGVEAQWSQTASLSVQVLESAAEYKLTGRDLSATHQETQHVHDTSITATGLHKTISQPWRDSCSINDNLICSSVQFGSVQLGIRWFRWSLEEQNQNTIKTPDPLKTLLSLIFHLNLDEWRVDGLNVRTVCLETGTNTWGWSPLLWFQLQVNMSG